jgi:hypothetical protein
VVVEHDHTDEGHGAHDIEVDEPDLLVAERFVEDDFVRSGF